MPDRFMKQFEILLAKAASDLAAARHLLRVQDIELDMGVIFFHLQQAAEKYLKAMLAFHGVHFEKVHDLERLLAMCTQHDIALPDYAASFVELNPYAVEGRYDLIVDDTHDAERFCERIAAFREFCTTHILP